MTQIIQDTSIFIQMAVYYFIITNVRYGTTTSDTTCTRINNDCSGWTTWLYRYKKEEKSRSPRPCSNTNDAFIIPPSLKISPIWHIWVEESDSSRHLSGIIQKLDMWHQGTEDLPLLNFASEFLGGNSLSPPWRKAGERKCLSCNRTGPAQLVTLPFIKLSSDTSEICWH